VLVAAVVVVVVVLVVLVLANRSVLICLSAEHKTSASPAVVMVGVMVCGAVDLSTHSSEWAPRRVCRVSGWIVREGVELFSGMCLPRTSLQPENQAQFALFLTVACDVVPSLRHFPTHLSV
jgi:hypothetical protein